MGRSATGLGMLGFWLFGCLGGQSGHDSALSDQGLRSCEESAQCDGLSCVCGVCTEACLTDGECGGVASSARCRSTGSGALGDRCSVADKAAAASVCVAECERDLDCRASDPDLRCEAGLCVGPTATGDVISVGDGGVDTATGKDDAGMGNTDAGVGNVDGGVEVAPPLGLPPAATPAWSDLGPGRGDCVIDVATDPGGDIAVVERRAIADDPSQRSTHHARVLDASGHERYATELVEVEAATSVAIDAQGRVGVGGFTGDGISASAVPTHWYIGLLDGDGAELWRHDGGEAQPGSGVFLGFLGSGGNLLAALSAGASSQLVSLTAAGAIDWEHAQEALVADVEVRDGTAVLGGRAGDRTWLGEIDTAGATQWEFAEHWLAPRQVGDSARAVAIADDGSVYAIGLYNPRGDGAANEGLHRFSASGELLWSVEIDDLSGGGDRIQPRDLAVDAAGHVVVVGVFGNASIPEQSNEVVWIASFDAEGNQRWARSFAAKLAGPAQAWAVAIGAGDAIIVGGCLTAGFGEPVGILCNNNNGEPCDPPPEVLFGAWVASFANE